MSNLNKYLKNITVYFIVLIVFVLISLLLFKYFYSTSQNMYDSYTESLDCSNFNISFLQIIKTTGIRIKEVGVNNEDLDDYYIKFETMDKNEIRVYKVEDIIFIDDKAVCENVDSFKVFLDKSIKEQLNIELIINGETYNLQYTMDKD